MTYLISDITFYKVDEDGDSVKDKNGNTKLFTPKGRWKDLDSFVKIGMMKTLRR